MHINVQVELERTKAQRVYHSFCLYTLSSCSVSNPYSAQIVPNIAQDSTVDVTIYSRTRMWYVPGVPTVYSSFWKALYATVPFALRIQHICSYAYVSTPVAS